MPPRVLPLWPHILFGILEPLACTIGWYTALSSPIDYHNRQVPSPSTSASTTPNTAITPSATVLVFQLGNVLLLLAALALLCCWTSHPEITRRYLMIVAVADVGHIYSCYAGMGSAQFWDFANYNDMAWGNIGSSAFLCVNRVATVLGVFGEIRNPVGGKGRKKV